MVKAGFSIGIQIWIVFLITLFVLQYPASFSIVFGAIAGLAGGVIAAYLRIPNQTPRPAERRSFNLPWKALPRLRLGPPVEGEEREATNRGGWLKRRPRKTLRSRRKSS